MQRADRRKYHYIYKITRDDGRFYIGMHSTDNLDDGYFGSGKLITASIKKHGRDRHTKEILEFVDSRQNLKDRERELVTDEIICQPLCMNLKLGGIGGWDHISDAQLKACRLAGASAGGKAAIAKRHEDKKLVSEIASKSAATRKTKGNELSFLGRMHTDAAKTAISEKNKLMTGERNSQFGTCWVTNGIKPVKIKIEHLDEYLTKGFVRGRNILR